MLTTTDATAGSRFGATVAVTGDTVLVGAPDADVQAGERAGAVHEFECIDGRWQRRATLTPDGGSATASFGGSISFSEDVVVIGARGDTNANESYAGAAYVFERSGCEWHRRAKLTASDGDSYDSFGQSVAHAGDAVLVGAPFDEDPAGEDRGAVYAFENADGRWHQREKFVPDDATSGDGFGGSLAFAGDTALVGANSFYNPAGSHSSAVYRYERSSDGWHQRATITVDGIGPRGNFGSDVALDGDTALISAFSDDTPNGDDTGSVYVFERTDGAWQRAARLFANDGETDDLFGSDVALDGDTALVGAPRRHDADGDETGAAYVFDRVDGDWRQRKVLLANYRSGGPDDADSLGQAVALANGVALVGDPMQESAGDVHGAAHVFTV